MGTRVAIIDRYVGETWYSSQLQNALSKYCEEVFYYGNNKSVDKAQRVWTPRLFPFQIISRAWKDKIDTIIVNFEVSIFGTFLTNFLIPILYILAKMLGLKILTIVHVVTPKKFFIFDNESSLPKGFPKHMTLLKFSMLMAYKILNFFSDKLIVHSKVFENWLREYVDSNKIVVIPHGVINDHRDYRLDIRRILDNRFPESFGSKKKILCFGVISPRKGLDIAISAFSKIEDKDICLLIAGKEMAYYAGYLDSLKNMVIDMDEDRVWFLGYLSDEDVHSFHEIADVIVLPYTMSVSASGALAFAMQHGKPTILTNTEFFVEEVDDDEALFVLINDIERLSTTMNMLIHDEEMKKFLGAKFKNKAKRNSWDNVAKMYMEICS